MTERTPTQPDNATETAHQLLVEAHLLPLSVLKHDLSLGADGTVQAPPPASLDLPRLRPNYDREFLHQLERNRESLTRRAGTILGARLASAEHPAELAAALRTLLDSLGDEIHREQGTLATARAAEARPERGGVLGLLESMFHGSSWQRSALGPLARQWADLQRDQRDLALTWRAAVVDRADQVRVAVEQQLATYGSERLAAREAARAAAKLARNEADAWRARLVAFGADLPSSTFPRLLDLLGAEDETFARAAAARSVAEALERFNEPAAAAARSLPELVLAQAADHTAAETALGENLWSTLGQLAAERGRDLSWVQEGAVRHLATQVLPRAPQQATAAPGGRVFQVLDRESAALLAGEVEVERADFREARPGALGLIQIHGDLAADELEPYTRAVAALSMAERSLHFRLFASSPPAAATEEGVA